MIGKSGSLWLSADLLVWDGRRHGLSGAEPYNCHPMFLLKRLSTPLGHNAAVKLASELIGRIATFLLALWAARQLGEAGFGVYNYGLALGFVSAGKFRS